VTAEVEAAIVAEYLGGAKLRDIEEKHGVARATVYWVLSRNDVAPSRAKPKSRLKGNDNELAALFKVIEAQDQRIQLLEALLAKHRIPLDD
jgi:transposase